MHAFDNAQGFNGQIFSLLAELHTCKMVSLPPKKAFDRECCPSTTRQHRRPFSIPLTTRNHVTEIASSTLAMRQASVAVHWIYSDKGPGLNCLDRVSIPLPTSSVSAPEVSVPAESEPSNPCNTHGKSFCTCNGTQCDSDFMHLLVRLYTTTTSVAEMNIPPSLYLDNRK